MSIPCPSPPPRTNLWDEIQRKQTADDFHAHEGWKPQHQRQGGKTEGTSSGGKQEDMTP